MEKNYVYRFLNYDNEVIYVGKTNDLHRRMRTHFGPSHHLPSECYDQVYKIEYAMVGSAYNAEIYETFFIDQFHPVYNTDKKYRISDVDIKAELPPVKWNNLKFEIVKTGIRFLDCGIPYNHVDLRPRQQVEGAVEYSLNIIRYHPYMILHKGKVLQRIPDIINKLETIYNYALRNMDIEDSDFSEALSLDEEEQIAQHYIAFALKDKVPDCFGELLRIGWIQYQYHNIFWIPVMSHQRIQEFDKEHGFNGKN